MSSTAAILTLTPEVRHRPNKRSKGQNVLWTPDRVGKDDTIGQRITNARIAANKTIKAVAEHIGLAPPTVNNYETDIVPPKYGSIVQIADFLNTTPEWLAFGRGEQAVDKRPIVEEVVFNNRHIFSHRTSWEISQAWLQGQHNLRPDEAVLYEVTEANSSGSVAPGDMILVERDAGPADHSKIGEEEFLYIYDKKPYIGTLGREKTDYLGVGDDPKAVTPKVEVQLIGRMVSTFLGGAQA